MQKYIAKRILFLIPTIIGVTLIIYLIMNITPGDPGRAILGSGVSQADVDAYNHAIGYDLPFFSEICELSQQYVSPPGLWHFLCYQAKCIR